MEPWFLEINPLGETPVMRVCDQVVTESVSIMTLIIDLFDLPDHWYPKDLVKRAKVD
jgi:glutathione S-transferase